MWPIAVLGIAALVLMLERTYALFFKVINRSSALTTILKKLILSRNITKAVQVASADPTPLGRIIRAGLLNVRREDEVVQSAMDEASMAEIPELERRTGFLPMLSNVATLTGLLGTIVGLISSFSAVSEADAATKSTLLADGISEAMNCTAFGLIVAIPCLLAYAILQSRTQRYIDEINASSVMIVNLVILNRDKLGLTVEAPKGSAEG
ncbi:MAG: MotA/TolQ/ExbB proton channel family protein [Myxococcales bacterium]|nr:MotA/TolQ/ExbB proton channel family protein [Myxococcales bacterium]